MGHKLRSRSTGIIPSEIVVQVNFTALLHRYGT